MQKNQKCKVVEDGPKKKRRHVPEYDIKDIKLYFDTPSAEASKANAEKMRHITKFIIHEKYVIEGNFTFIFFAGSN